MPKTRQSRIENGIELLPCTKCGKYLPKESFYLDKRTGNIRGPCKTCYLEWHQKVYCQRPEVINKERIRSIIRGKTTPAKCRGVANEAIQAGRLIRPNFCPVCGVSHIEKRIEAHHDDYFRPLEVKWMCSLCHAKYHQKLKEVL